MADGSVSLGGVAGSTGYTVYTWLHRVYWVLRRNRNTGYTGVDIQVMQEEQDIQVVLDTLVLNYIILVID